MKKLLTSNGLTFKVSDCDYDTVKKYNWCAIKNGHTYYVRAWINKKRTPIHRFLLDVNDPDVFVDHIDRNGLNNCRDNLRKCTHSQNQMNRIASGKSKFKGVSTHTSNKYSKLKSGEIKNYTYTNFLATIKIDGKQKCLGLFKNESAAAIAYNLSASKHFGQFAKLNVI